MNLLLVLAFWLSGAPTRFAGPNSSARRVAGGRGEQGFESRNAGCYDAYRSFKSGITIKGERQHVKAWEREEGIVKRKIHLLAPNIEGNAVPYGVILIYIL